MLAAANQRFQATRFAPRAPEARTMRRRARPSLRPSRRTRAGSSALTPAVSDGLIADRAGARQSAHRGGGTRAVGDANSQDSRRAEEVCCRGRRHTHSKLTERSIWPQGQ
jgi:hypothetical protein